MLFKVALRNVIRNFRRSLITVLTVAIGTSGLFLFQAFNEGIMVGNRDMTVHGKYGHGQVTTKGYRDMVRENPWENWIEQSDQIDKGITAIPGVLDVFPRIEFFALLSNGSINLGGKGIGVDGQREGKFFHAIRMVEGTDLGDDQDGIVLGKGLAVALGVKVGDRLTLLGNTIRGSINGLDLIVKGVFQFGLREIDDSLFHIQISRAQDLLDTDKVEYFSLGLQTFEDWEGVQAAIEKKYPELQATSFAVLDKIWYQHTIDWLASQYLTIRMIILSIVVLGIFNSASTAILERTREIGMLRANGESQMDILSMLFWEGLIVAFAGGLAGIVAVIFLNITVLREGISMPPPPGFTEVMPVFIQLTLGIGAVAFLSAGLTAVLATILAGIKVAKMSISQALRSV